MCMQSAHRSRQKKQNYILGMQQDIQETAGKAIVSCTHTWQWLRSEADREITPISSPWIYLRHRPQVRRMCASPLWCITNTVEF